ncbi:MAG: helix-turn-helix domain-containing protein [Umezawaea sp.]
MALVSIGEFARLSRLSPKALRLYDELGLLVPTHVDTGTGYRWYSAGQLGRAGLVAALRRIGIPLARVKDLLALEPPAAAEEIRAHWAGTEAEHAARRQLVGDLVDRLCERESEMSEVEVRDVPARWMLSVVRRVRQEELVPTGRELFIHRLRRGGVARAEGIAGAPFMIYHGEVGGDSDGPVEWCWPIPDEGAEEVAARFPDLTLRNEGAHQEAFIREGAAGRWDSGARAEQVLKSLAAWVVEAKREPAGALRLVLVPNANGERTGPDGEFAVPLR